MRGWWAESFSFWVLQCGPSPKPSKDEISRPSSHSPSSVWVSILLISNPQIEDSRRKFHQSSGGEKYSGSAFWYRRTFEVWSARDHLKYDPFNKIQPMHPPFFILGWVFNTLRGFVFWEFDTRENLRDQKTYIYPLQTLPNTIICGGAMKKETGSRWVLCPGQQKKVKLFHPWTDKYKKWFFRC